MNQPAPGFIDPGTLQMGSGFDPNNIPGFSPAAEPQTSEQDIEKMVQDWFANQANDQGAGGAASQPLPPSPDATPAFGDGGPQLPPNAQPIDQGIPPLPPVIPDVDDLAGGYKYEPPDPWAHLTHQQREALLGAYQQMASWAERNPQAAEYVDGLMSGRYQFGQPVPAQQPQPQPQGFVQQAPIDPRNPQQQQGIILPQQYQEDINAVKTVTRALWEERQAAQHAMAQQAYDTTVEQFAIANRLSKEQMEGLIRTTQQSGIVRGLSQAGHDPATAIRKAFEFTYATEPAFSTHRANLEQARNVEQQNRARKQAALAGSGGNSTRSPVSPAQPTGDRLTETSRVQGMASFIRQAQGQ